MPIAQRLFDAFGSLEGTVNASATDLEKVAGGGVALAIISSRALVDAALQERVERVTVDPLDACFHDFLKRKIANLRYERLFAVFVDGSNRFIHSQQLAGGTERSVDAPIAEMLSRAGELRARGILLAHNHPSGDPTPSHEDLAATRVIARRCAESGVTLISHLVVAANRVSPIDWMQGT